MNKEYQEKMLYALQLILLANGIAQESVAVLLIIFSKCPEKILDWAVKVDDLGIVSQEHIVEMVKEALRMVSKD